MVESREPDRVGEGFELLGGQPPAEGLHADGAAIPPGPISEHQRVAAVLMAELHRHFDAELGVLGGWWIHYRPRVQLEGVEHVPDLVGWRQSRLPRQPQPSGPATTVRPDWVCEVLLPHTALRDRCERMAHYERAGVPRVWLVDPMTRTVEVHVRDRMGLELVACFVGECIARPDPFDDVQLDLSVLWLPSRPPVGHLP
jgi:Uma2 family endonuclease